MIQAISSVNVQNNKSVTPLKPQSFGHREQAPQGYVVRKKPSPLMYFASQFASGAAISVVLDSMFSAYGAVTKNPAYNRSFSSMAKNAGFWGLAWIAMGLVLNTIGRGFTKNY